LFAHPICIVCPPCQPAFQTPISPSLSRNLGTFEALVTYLVVSYAMIVCSLGNSAAQHILTTQARRTTKSTSCSMTGDLSGSQCYLCARPRPLVSPLATLQMVSPGSYSYMQSCLRTRSMTHREQDRETVRQTDSCARAHTHTDTHTQQTQHTHRRASTNGCLPLFQTAGGEHGKVLRAKGLSQPLSFEL